MSYLTAQPDLMADAAGKLAEIRGSIDAATSAATVPTTNLAAAADDEVSAAIARLFGAYGEEGRSAIGLAAAFQDEFAQVLSGSGLAYLETEVSNAAAAALNPILTPLQSLLSPAAVNPAAGVITLVMGASGYPIPSSEYIQGLPSIFVDPWSPFGGGLNIGINTPEGLYPLTGVKSLTFDISAQQGMTILNNSINQAFASGYDSVNVFGYSQSAVIASMEMRALNPSNTPTGSSLPLSFSLVGNPSNPNGGLLTRFSGLSLPSLGLDLFGTATPDNSFPTSIFTREYDGFADFPQYPLNLVSDINAFAGIIELHGGYPFLSPDQLTPPPGGDLVELTNTVGPVQTHYYMIPTEHLPILAPLRALPVIGHPLADLIEPDMRVIVNLGYGSTTQGWSPDPPNVPTPFGVLPPVSAVEVAQALGTGTQQGISAFAQDVNALVASPASVSMPDPQSVLGSVGTGGNQLGTGMTSALSSPEGFIAALQSANSYVVNGVTASAAAAYATLLPTADVANALVTSVPSYDVNLFLSGLDMMANGDPLGGAIYALGAPIAADTGLGTLFAGFEVRVFQHALSQIINAWSATSEMSTPVAAAVVG